MKIHLYNNIGRGKKFQAPSGRELSAKLTEGECVTMENIQSQSHAGSFRHAGACHLPPGGRLGPNPLLRGYWCVFCRKTIPHRLRRSRYLCRGDYQPPENLAPPEDAQADSRRKEHNTAQCADDMLTNTFRCLRDTDRAAGRGFALPFGYGRGYRAGWGR